LTKYGKGEHVKLNKHSLAGRKLAGKAGHIRVEPEGAVVTTNMKALVAVSPPEHAAHVPGGFSMKADTADLLAGMMKKGTATLLNLDPENRGKNRGVEFLVDDLDGESERVTGFVPTEAFPNWRKMIAAAATQEQVSVVVNRKHLLALLEAIDGACPDPDHNPVRLTLCRDRLLVRAANYITGQQAVGCVIELDPGEWIPESDWVNGVLDPSKAVTRIAKKVPPMKKKLPPKRLKGSGA
jgi:hypothetical protein